MKELERERSKEANYKKFLQCVTEHKKGIEMFDKNKSKN